MRCKKHTHYVTSGLRPARVTLASLSTPTSLRLEVKVVERSSHKLMAVKPPVKGSRLVDDVQRGGKEDEWWSELKRASVTTC